MRIASILIPCVFVASVAAGQTTPTKVQPTPRAANGKPDLTGVYQASPRRGAWDAEAPGDEPGVPAERRPIARAESSRLRQSGQTASARSNSALSVAVSSPSAWAGHAAVVQVGPRSASSASRHSTSRRSTAPPEKVSVTTPAQGGAAAAKFRLA